MNDQQENPNPPDAECSSLRSDAPEKPRRGRPPGAKDKSPRQYSSRSYVIVPDGCRKCNSTEFDTLSTPKQMSTNVTIKGVEYNHITWRRCKCKRCGVVCMRIFYRNI